MSGSSQYSLLENAPRKRVLHLELAVAIMESVAGREGYAAWLDEHRDALKGHMGLYREVVDFAEVGVDAEIQSGRTDLLYELADMMADHMTADPFITPDVSTLTDWLKAQPGGDNV